MLAIALIMGGVAVYLVNTLITREKEVGAETQPVGIRPVVVAATDLDVGTRLDKVMIKPVDWPEASMPDGHFSEVDKVIGEKPEEAPVVLKEIRKGEPVLKYKLSEYAARGGLTPKIPVEKRAITIAVNEVKGVAGFVLPGDRVDVMLTSSVGRADNQPVTRTLLQNVTVLGVDQIASEKEDEPQIVNAVTLLVTPDEGKKLTLAQTVGSLNLMLRNEGDVSIASDELITLSSLRSYARRPVTKTTRKVTRRPAPSGTTVQIIRGLDSKNERVKNVSTPVVS
ncbi:MAG: Flp pilus assembly protein CpaB, partial [Granulosicoccaceae bacterium]